MLVAEITKDHIFSEWDSKNGFKSQEGKDFEYEAMPRWWGWGDMPRKEYFSDSPKTEFQLFDDDGELYFEGWLHNDGQCLVQQFVLNWAEHDSGCTIIKVKKDGSFIQEIA